MLLVLAAVAAALLFSSRSQAYAASVGSAPGGSAPADPSAELARLAKESPDVSAEVLRLLAGPGNPSVMATYAARLKGSFPQIALLLSRRFDDTVVKTTGKSGMEWNTWSAGPRPDGWIPVDVLEGAAPVLSYAQNGADKSSRKLIGIATPGASGFKATPNAVQNARSDFGV
jgi:hypothetical protein